jgi:hypothetical protein
LPIYHHPENHDCHVAGIFTGISRARNLAVNLVVSQFEIRKLIVDRTDLASTILVRIMAHSYSVATNFIGSREYSIEEVRFLVFDEAAKRIST